MNAISVEQFRELEHKILMGQYRKLLDKGLHPKSSIRFIRVSNDELLSKIHTN